MSTFTYSASGQIVTMLQGAVLSTFTYDDDEIYVINADGTGQTNLSNNSAFDFYPAFSPDGLKIAFVSGRDGNREVYVMDADGRGHLGLTKNKIGNDEPSFPRLQKKK